MKPMRFILWTGVALLMTACASSPSSPSQLRDKATVAAAKDKVAGVIENKNKEMAKIIVTREFVIPIALKAKVNIGDKSVGKLKNGKFLVTYVEPGDHELSISYAKWSMNRGVKQPITVVAGETYAFEIESDEALSILGVSNVRVKSFDPIANPFKISDLEQIATTK